MLPLHSCNTLVYLYTICVPMISLTGNVTVSSVQFQRTSELNATTPTFTLTCTSTGGPATTVSWRRDGTMLSDDSTYSITSQVTDAMTATYNHTLTVTGRLVGEYECNVSNNKPSSSSGMVTVVGKNFTLKMVVKLNMQV